MIMMMVMQDSSSTVQRRDTGEQGEREDEEDSDERVELRSVNGCVLAG